MSKGKHRKSSLPRVIIAGTVSALAALGAGVAFALAQSHPAAVRIAADPVLPPEPAASPVPSQSPPKVYYVAREGDTLWGIAASQCHHGGKWNVLAAANRIASPYTVTPGQRLTVTC